MVKKQMPLLLYPHQHKTCENLNEIYKNHRSAGAVMPTGSGKSYVAMHQMIAAKNNPNYHGIAEDGTVMYDIKNGVVNDAKIYYLSPTTDIVLQIQKDIVKEILGMDTSKIETEDLEKIVRKAFPNLHFICYQGLNSDHLEGEKNGIVNLENAAPDLVISDETHRSGAHTFMPAIEKLLGYKREDEEDDELLPVKDPNAIPEKDKIQFLSISATPERDVDSRDMSKYWNRLIGGYTEEELEQRADLGINLSLSEAVERKIVTPIEIIAFDANLVDTEQYKYLVRQTTNPKIAPSLRNEFLENLREVNSKIFGENFKDFHLLKKEQQEQIKLEKNAEVLAQAIEEGKFSLSGKYIVFSKPQKNADGSIQESGSDKEKKADDKSTMKHLKNQYKVVGNMLELALDKTNKKVDKIEDYYLASQAQSQELNRKILDNFDKAGTESGQPLRFITATQKLDEGVHIHELMGSFMLKPIAEAGENISLRGQSIRFLQEVGRNMSAVKMIKTDDGYVPDENDIETRIIFDYCNNVFRQNVNKVLERKQTIDAFKLNSNQQFLVDTYRSLSAKIPPNGELPDEYSKLLGVLEVLRKYYKPLNANVLKSTLERTLECKEFIDKKEEILKELKQKGLNKITSFGKKLKQARDLLYKGGISFSTFNIKELEELGFLDRTSVEGLKKYQNSTFIIDDKNFVCSAPLGQLIYQNTETGTEYDVNGKDIDGFEKGQFDEITGLDKDGFNRKGFNKEGIHKITGTIHDESGFMADGINIQTGTIYDLNGFDYRGYKLVPFYNVDENGTKIEVNDVVLDRNGMFHKVFVDQETGIADFDKISKIGTKYYKLMDGKNIDCYGFLSNRDYNIISEQNGLDPRFVRQMREIKDVNGETRVETYYYDRQGNCYEGGKLFKENSCEYDIEGYDENGFNQDEIHRDTGTRYDKNGFKKKDYKSDVMQIRNANLVLPEEIAKELNVDSSGKSIITDTYKDIYGFTVLNYDKCWSDQKNEYGFTTNDIPKSVLKMQPYEISDCLYKKVISGMEEYKVNILGTTMKGTNPQDGKIDNSILFMRDYTEQCIKNGVPEESFIIQFAKNNKMLVNESRTYMKVSLNKAMQLYRICPEYAMEQETIDMMNTIAKAPSKNLQNTLFKHIPDLSQVLIQDISDLNFKIKDIDKTIGKISDKYKKENLEQIKQELINKKENFEEIKDKEHQER